MPDAANRQGGFAQQTARLEYPAVLQQVDGRPPAGVLATARQMGWRDAQNARQIADPGTAAKLLFHQVGEFRHQPPRRIGARRFALRAQGLTFQPDPQQAQIMFRRAAMGGHIAVQFTLHRVQRHVQVLLGMHLADAQMQRGFGQLHRTVLAEKDCGAKDLRANLKPVHDAGRNKDGVVGGIAARHAGQRDAALTLGEPQKARLGQGTHRLDPPPATCGQSGNRHKAKARGVADLGHVLPCLGSSGHVSSTRPRTQAKKRKPDHTTARSCRKGGGRARRRRVA